MKWFVTVLCAVFIGACSSNTETPETTSEFKVALITPSSVNDSGWSALAYRGLEAIQVQCGAEIQNVVASSPQDIKDAMRTYAQKNFSLVIGHGYEYNSIGIEVGKDFPKTVFVSSSGDKTAPNVGTFRFYLEQGTYLLGMVGAKMSKSGVLGMVGGPNVPSIESTFQAFEAGAKSVRPDIKVLKAYTNSNDDVGAAKQQTLAFISQGADFVIHQANAAAQGVFEACKERGFYAFGTNSDQAGDAPDTVLASAVIVAEPVFVELANEVKNGSFKSGVRVRGMAEGAIGFIWNPALESKVPANMKKLVDDTMAKIKSGAITVPKLEF
jgi:basic membrane lipoprotein Med (substrate-binding protein (PBP1-ABC) superfamily)